MCDQYFLLWFLSLLILNIAYVPQKAMLSKTLGQQQCKWPSDTAQHLYSLIKHGNEGLSHCLPKPNAFRLSGVTHLHSVWQQQLAVHTAVHSNLLHNLFNYCHSRPALLKSLLEITCTEGMALEYFFLNVSYAHVWKTYSYFSWKLRLNWINAYQNLRKCSLWICTKKMTNSVSCCQTFLDSA